MNTNTLSHIAGLSFFLFATSPTLAVASVSDPRSVITEAKALLREGNARNNKESVMKAHEMLRILHEKSPGKESLYFLAQAEYELVRLGVGDKESGLYEQYLDSALENVEQIMSKHKTWSEGLALFSMVQGYRIARTSVNALTAGPKAYFSAQEAIRLDSTNPRAWLVYGIAKLNAPAMFGGSKKEALSSLQRSIALFENQNQALWNEPDWGYIDALVWTGWAYEQTEQPGEAKASYRKALGAEPRAMWVQEMFLKPLEQKLGNKGKP